MNLSQATIQKGIDLSGGVGIIAMRYVFVDEAGRDEKSPLTIVVGIIAHADQHVMLAEGILAEIAGAVPYQFRSKFSVFHADDIWNQRELKEEWRLTDRIELLHNIMEIPRRIGMAVSVGLVRREKDVLEEDLIKLKPFEARHVLAFRGCLCKADKYIRDYASPTEVATIVCEDVEGMRAHLNQAINKVRSSEYSMVLSNRMAVKPTKKDESQGFISQTGDMRIVRIRRGISFVKKDEEPLVQIADACAFGLRRFFCEQDHGDAMAHAILGGLPCLEDFSGLTSYSVYFPHPTKRIISFPMSCE